VPGAEERVAPVHRIKARLTGAFTFLPERNEHLTASYDDVEKHVQAGVAPAARATALPGPSKPITHTTMPETSLYCNNSITFRIGESFELIHSELSGATHQLPHDVAALLGLCRNFKTIDQHAEGICGVLASRRSQMDLMLVDVSAQVLPSFVAKLLRRGGRAQAGEPSKLDRAEADSVRKQLSKFIEMGLMVSDADLMTLLDGKAEEPESPRAITSVGVVTHDRVTSLARCLASYVENGIEHGRRNDFVVVDDSENPAVRKSSTEILASLKKKLGVGIFYAGPEEKQRFADELTRCADIPPDVLTFALFGAEKCGPPIGANRNALLLHAVGELIFSADDDTVCRIASSPHADKGLAFFSETDPTQFWFFPDREAIRQSISFVKKDILAIHEEMLGRDLYYCVSTLNGGTGPELSQTTSQFLRGLRSGRGKVLTTFTGMLGDSGMYSPHSYFLLDADSHKRLTLSEENYRFATTSREILRVANRRTISSDWWFPATTMGFDNRSLLPPFFPVLRNEDGVFGATVRACFEHQYSGFLPWAILHAPLEPRSYMPDDFLKSASSCRLCDILVACISAFTPPKGMTDERKGLRALGDFLTEVASLAPHDFEEFVKVQLYRLASDHACRLETDLRFHRGVPVYWAEHLRTYLDTLIRALSNRDYIVPDDLSRLSSAEEARALTRVLVRGFGRLLCWWPEIVEAAKDLRARGRRLAREV